MANETVELYYKGKPINPNRDLPTRTYAEAQAEGLTSSDKLWVRKDGDGTIITANQVPYDSNNSVKDKIDEISTRQKVQAENGDYYNSYVTSLYAKDIVEKNGVVICTFSFALVNFNAESGWKTIFRLPNSIPKPIEAVSTFVVSSAGDYERMLIDTTGDINLNTTYGNAHRDGLVNVQLMYITA